MIKASFTGFSDLGKAEVTEPSIGTVLDLAELGDMSLQRRNMLVVSKCLLIDGEPIGQDRLLALGMSHLAEVTRAAEAINALAERGGDSDQGNAR